MNYATQFEIDRAAQRVIDGQPVANPRLVAAAMESLQNKVADQAERIIELEEEFDKEWAESARLERQSNDLWCAMSDAADDLEALSHEPLDHDDYTRLERVIEEMREAL